jgi:hypothetical protein
VKGGRACRRNDCAKRSILTPAAVLAKCIMSNRPVRVSVNASNPLRSHRINRRNRSRRCRERLPIGHRPVGLVRFAGGPDGPMEVGPLLRLIFSLEEMADGMEAVTGLALVGGFLAGRGSKRTPDEIARPTGEFLVRPRASP